MDLLHIRHVVDRVGEPGGVGRPDRLHVAKRTAVVNRLAVDGADLAACENDDVEVAPVVLERQLLRIRRPAEAVIKAGAVERVRLDLTLSILRSDVELVLAGSVGEVRHRFSIGRPGGAAFVRARGLGEVSRVALFRGHGHDLAPHLEDSSRSGRRDVGAPEKFRTFDVTRPGLLEIGRHADREIADLAGRDVIGVNCPGLLEDDGAVAGGGSDDGEFGVAGQLHDLFAAGVESEEIELAVAVGPEVHRVADPHGIGVVAAVFRLRDLLGAVIRKGVKPDGRCRTTTVVLPLAEGFAEGGVGESGAVG